MSEEFEEGPVRVGLNGFGRIGRNVFRAVVDRPGIELVGINDIMDPDEMRYLAKYDTVMGRLDGLELHDDHLVYRDVRVPLYSESDPANLPWDDLDVDVAIEATGVFRTYEEATKHLDAGARTVLLSAPAKGETPVKTIVYGVNHDEYDGEDVLSNGSCTTNSIAPIAKVLNERFGIRSGLLTTVHAYTSSQELIDGPASDPRRGRAAAENVIPTSTGAAVATAQVLPELEGKLNGMAMRVPVPNGSISDFTIDLEGEPDADTVNDALRDAASGELQGVLGYTDDEVVSRDILGVPFSSYVDLNSTMAIDGGLTKVLAWYDNEFGFAHRMLDVARYVMTETERIETEARP